jgi:glycosyltransferase involved in cell wall biosynthesis
MLRVAIIGGKFHSGGKKNLIMEYYRHIDRTKVQFDLICDSDSNAIPYDEFKELGGRIFVISPYENLIKHMKDLYRILKDNKYEIIHAFDNTLNIFPMYIGYLCGIKVRINESISMSHRGELKTYIKLFLRPFSKFFSNYYMSCGEESGKWQFGNKLYNQGKVNVFKTVINAKTNAFNPELRASTRASYGWDNDIIYGFIGRFEKQKNPLFLIDIFNEISKRQSNAKLVIIGSGSLENQMRKKVNHYQIDKKVEFLGRREDIKQFYNAFDAFLLPSLYEGLPVVGLESQSAGLPIFFSTEITREASACEELGIYISLKSNVADWADIIIEKTINAIPLRKSYDDVLISKGYDSSAEAKRLQDFYLSTLNTETLN